MQSYYIASKLENAEQVRELKVRLDALGWKHTYDWTVHGSVQGDASRCREVAAKEMEGVYMAAVVIVLLPGGRGTHVELGCALGIRDCVAGDDPGPRIVVYSPDPDKDFGTDGTTCAFYHHPLVERFTDLDVMFRSLTGAP